MKWLLIDQPSTSSWRLAGAAAKSLQSCPTPCDPIDGSPSGYPVPGILQARTLEWGAISLSNAWKWKVKVKSLSHVWLLATPRTAAYQAPLSMGFSRQEYWSGVPLPSPSWRLRWVECDFSLLKTWPCFFIIIYLFINFWPCMVFKTAHGISSSGEQGATLSLWWVFSPRWLLSLQSTGSRCVGLSPCFSRALGPVLGSCGART